MGRNLPKGVTLEMAKSWDEKWGKKLKVISIPKEEAGPLEVVAHVPDRRTIGNWERYADSDPTKAKEILIKNSLLTGVEEVMADDEAFQSCAVALMKMAAVKEAEIKNF